MSEREILIDAVPGELRAAVLANGRLEDLVIARETDDGRAGNIFLGRIRRIERGAGGAFVDLGLARPGFLPLEGRRRERRFTEGAAIVVQVTAAATVPKGARLSTRIALTGRFLVFTPDRDGPEFDHRLRGKGVRARLARIMEETKVTGGNEGGFVLRAAAEDAEASDLSREARELRAEWRAVDEARRKARAPALLRREPDVPGRILRDHAGAGASRVVIEGVATFAAARAFCRRFMPDLESRLVLHAGPAPLFVEREIDAKIETALAPRVTLTTGAALTIEETEALTAVDVDTGAAAGRAGGRSALLDTALAAADEVARQIRLRNISGLVVVDIPRLRDRRARRRVLERLRERFADDPRPAHVHGFTAAGLVEITRQRVDEPLSRLFGEPCPACAGATGGRGRVPTAATVAFECLRTLLREAAANPGARLELEAAPEIVAHLQGPGRAYLLAAERTIARQVPVSANRRFGRERFEVAVT